MILAHVNPATRTVALVSIPRDLSVNNRKINAVWTTFGMEELKRQIATLTGYEINRYVLIDMYAFIDVVDALGGIDVTLTKRVVDPTYRTFDNGVWSTLKYEPGTHHLSGKQALRLARTRHTSSDFARAERQQQILEAIRERLKLLHANDASTLASLVQIAVSKTQTDITPQEAVRAFFRYSGYTVQRGSVLSTANVLVSKRTNDEAVAKKSDECAKLTSGTPERTACDVELAELDRGAYILLPRDGNWQLIRWFVWKAFEG